MSSKQKYLVLSTLIFLLIGCNSGGSNSASGEQIFEPEEVKSEVSKDIRSGDVTGALKYVTESEKSYEVLTSLAPDKRAVLADWIEQAEFVEGDDNRRIYRFYYPTETREHYMEFQMVKDSSGIWKISNW